MAVVAVGDFDGDHVEGLIKRYFSGAFVDGDASSIDDDDRVNVHDATRLVVEGGVAAEDRRLQLRLLPGEDG